jgi:catechol 2,3-dioxygenase-like lactoylglutathione lyase family enzyme
MEHAMAQAETSKDHVSWSIHRVSLATHNLAEARTFFETRLGLGQARAVGNGTLAFGLGSRGLRVQRPKAVMARIGADIVVQGCARHVAVEVADLHLIATRLAKASIAYVEAPHGDFDGPAIYAQDPALNVVAFCQATAPATPLKTIRPWETEMGWGVHHVNLQAGDVREAVAFYTEIAGMVEGQWQAPSARGDFSIDTNELAVLPQGEFNRGIHIIRADAGFAHRNNFPHNPSIGGHPAFFVPDVLAVKSRLQAAGTEVSDARIYAMAGMHQIYALDPTANVIEVNQFV